MKLLNLYLFKNYLRDLLLTNSVFLTLVLLYSLTVALTKNLFGKSLLDYLLSNFLVALFYLFPISSSVALLITLRGFLTRGLDRVCQSFSLNPLEFSRIFFILALFFCFFLILYADLVLPKALESSRLYERGKGGERRSYFGKDLWFKGKEGNRTYFLNLGSLFLPSGKLRDFFLFLEEGKNTYLIRAKEGILKGREIYLFSAKLYELNGGKERTLRGKVFKLPVGEEELVGFVKAVDFLSLRELTNLYFKGKEVGVNPQVYLGELLFRLSFCLYPLLLFPQLLYWTIRSRSFPFGLLILFSLAFFSFFLINLYRSLSRSGSHYGLLPLLLYLLLIAHSLKRIYDIKEGGNL